MKKFTAVFICILYLVSTQTCFAASNLYFIKNAKKDQVSALVQQGFEKDSSLTLRKLNPYLGISDDGKDYALVILQTSSNNLFYYFQSNKGSKVDKQIRKLLKKHDLEFEKSENTMYISTFENQAQKVLTNTSNNYDFSEPNIQKISTTPVTKKSDNTVLKGYVGEVAAGSTFQAYLQTPINTANANKGDTISAILTQNWVYNGTVIAPQGSVVSGVLTKARHATYGSRNGRVVIDFNEIRTLEGKVYNIKAEKIDFTVTNDGKWSNAAVRMAKSAAVGALTGLLFGLLSSASTGASTAIGAGVAAGDALISSTAERGVDAEIPIYTDLEIKLLKPLNVIFKH